MASKVTPPQNSFNAGELSPLIGARFDIAKYFNGCKTLQNALPLVEGGAKKMPGTYYVVPTKYLDKKARVVPFSFSTIQTYMLEFGDKYIRFFKNEGEIVIDDTSISNFYPKLTYDIGQYVKVGPYCDLNFGSSKHLYIAAQYQETGATGIQVACQLNTSDVLVVSAAANVITIKLANATASKNSAYLIQLALRALGTVNSVDVSLWTVSENTYYAASRPTMGSNLCTGGTPSADSNAGAGYGADKAFDNNIATRWQSASTALPHWLQYQLAVAKTVFVYSLLADVTYPTWSPKDFKLQGSNNGSTWTDLDTQSGISFASGEKKSFSISSPASYLYYQINVTANGIGNSTIIVEMELFEGFSLSVSLSGGNKLYQCIALIPTQGTQGPDNGGVFSSDSTVGAQPWANPSYAQNYDPQEAFVGLGAGFGFGSGNISYYLKVLGFNFSIPIGLNITGVLVEIAKRELTFGIPIKDYSVKLVKGGTIGGTDKATATEWPITSSYENYGGSTDLWGLALTPADTNASNFGIVISAQNTPAKTSNSAYINHIRMTVYFGIADFFPVTETSYWTEVIDGGPVEAITPYLEADLFVLDVDTQSADVLYIFHKQYSPKKLMRHSDVYWELKDLSITGGEPKKITGITKANPAVVTCPGHGFSNGASVKIVDVVGMTQLNGQTFTIQNVTLDTFELKSTDSTLWTTYILGGYAISGAPIFNVPNEYPACGTFFEQRLVIGGTINHPTTVYGSVIGDYENFLQDPTADDAAFQFNLLSRQVDGILWMVGQNDLLIGTIGGVWRLFGSQSMPLTATNVNAIKSISIGVGTVHPQMLNESVIWITRSASVVRLLIYNWQTDRWEAPDLTRLARHITIGATQALSGIIQTAFQAEPFPILWAVRADGQLLGMTYDYHEQVYAWFRIVTDGAIESVSVISQVNEEDQVWVIVNRTINGVTVRYIEYFMPHEFFSQIQDCFFVHGGLSATYGSPTTHITGLLHLKAKTVAILADGLLQTSKVVASDGSIDLDTAATKVTVGLPYSMIVEPMNPNAGSRQGTSRGKKQKINRATFCLYETVGGQYGNDQSHLFDIPFDSSVLFSGDKTLDFQGNWDDQAPISIVHDDPLPMTLLAIVPHLSIEDV